MTFSEIEKQLEASHWETARRLCLRELAKGLNTRISLLLHKAYPHLADVAALMETLVGIVPANE